MVPSKTCIGVAERLSAETRLEINIIHSGPLDYNYLVFVFSSCCCRLCRKTQLVHVVKGV